MQPFKQTLLPIFFIFLVNCTGTGAVFAAYPTDPAADLEWPYSSENTVAAVESRFNTARSNENSQLGTSLPMLSLPSQSEWDDMNHNDKALWLINREREDRNLLPLHGTESHVIGIAQYYAEYLLASNEFSHDADGNSPWQRLNTDTAINSCHDFLNIAENLAVLWGGWTLPVERSIYMWMYEDSGSNWGHRHAILWYPYENNSGPSTNEGFLGIGISEGTHQNWPDSYIVVMNVFDPCSTWQYALAGDVTGDGKVDLGDVIITLQLLSGREVSANENSDVDQDRKVGLAEAIWGLKKEAGIP